MSPLHHLFGFGGRLFCCSSLTINFGSPTRRQRWPPISSLFSTYEATVLPLPKIADAALGAPCLCKCRRSWPPLARFTFGKCAFERQSNNKHRQCRWTRLVCRVDRDCCSMAQLEEPFLSQLSVLSNFLRLDCCHLRNVRSLVCLPLLLRIPSPVRKLIEEGEKAC